MSRTAPNALLSACKTNKLQLEMHPRDGSNLFLLHQTRVLELQVSPNGLRFPCGCRDGADPYLDKQTKARDGLPKTNRIASIEQ